MGRRRPRQVSDAIGRIRHDLAPAGGLAGVQMAWSELVGEAVAAVTAPVSERDGTLRVNCSDAVWAEELSMMKSTLIERLNDRFGEAAPTDIRFIVGDVTK